MDIYNIVLSNAFVALLTAPLRRLRYLLTVEDDLIEEGVLPAEGFGGTLGCVRFLYNAGGRTVSVFYRGAFLEALGCIGKYELQRIISIPIARRVPLRMHNAFLATTFVHTALVYFTVAPLQTALDTIAVNGVTTFTVDEATAAAGAGATLPVRDNEDDAPAGKSEAATASGLAAPTAPRVHLRFSSSWDTAKHLAGHFPVASMVHRLYLIDFACRYVTSLANNKILTWLMQKAQQHYNGVEMTSFQRLVMYAGCPLIASLAMSAVTYPFATYPVAHFLRLRYYERCAEEKTRREAEAAQDYPVSPRHSTSGTSSSPNAHTSGGGGKDRRESRGSNNNNNRSNNSASNTSISFTLNGAEHGGRGGVERFWWEELFFHAVHSEVRDFLWRSIAGHDDLTAATAFASSTTTTPITAAPSVPAAQQPGSADAGGRHAGQRGIGQVYRGFGLIVVSTLLSSALAMTLNRAVDFVLHHSH